jgi:flagellar secretion chaperone FliS
MSTTPYRAYLESRVVSASPLQLVHLAYEGAINTISEAREHLANKRIFERSKAVTKAQLILVELQKSLDFNKGGDVAVQLNKIYDYVQRLLIDGNFRQKEAPFAEAQQLLQTLDESWKALSETENTVAAAASSSIWQSAGDGMPVSRTSFQL